MIDQLTNQVRRRPRLRRILGILRRTPGSVSRAVGRNVMGTITHVSTEDFVAALTFDDGPHPESTPRLLDILDSYQARATFFMLGEAAQRYPEVVQQVAQAGHAIGNHSWDHPSFPLIDGRTRRAQLRMCEKAIAPYGQRIFRPPFGHQSIASRLDAWLLGYQVVTWNVVAEDWLDHHANWMVNRVMEQFTPGSIILFHDTLNDLLEARYADREPTHQAIGMLLKRLSGHSRFVTVPELFQHGHPQRQNWYEGGSIQWLNSLSRQDETARRYVPSPR